MQIIRHPKLADDIREVGGTTRKSRSGFLPLSGWSWIVCWLRFNAIHAATTSHHAACVEPISGSFHSTSSMKWMRMWCIWWSSGTIEGIPILVSTGELDPQSFWLEPRVRFGD